MEDDAEDYFLPLEDQRVFGAGIKRKRITFVPAETSETISAPRSSSSNAGDHYLSIVLGKEPAKKSGKLSGELGNPNDQDRTSICPICNQEIVEGNDVVRASHESSIAHQVCLQHSHPPSHLDREHIGLKYLSGFGWDPDSRKGLGAQQEGILVPIKPKRKQDTAGLGLTVTNDVDTGGGSKGKKSVREKTGQVKRLNAKEVRQSELLKKKKAEQLRKSFYGEDLLHYLGPDG